MVSHESESFKPDNLLAEEFMLTGQTVILKLSFIYQQPLWFRSLHISSSPSRKIRLRGMQRPNLKWLQLLETHSERLSILNGIEKWNQVQLHLIHLIFCTVLLVLNSHRFAPNRCRCNSERRQRIMFRWWFFQVGTLTTIEFSCMTDSSDLRNKWWPV